MPELPPPGFNFIFCHEDALLNAAEAGDTELCERLHELRDASRKVPKDEPYPETVAESIDDDMRYRVGVTKIMKRYAKAKPWKGSFEDRCEKLATLFTELACEYGLAVPTLLIYTGIGHSYSYTEGAIRLDAKSGYGPSVLSALHEFGHYLGKGEKGTCRWSINLFKRHFPKSYSRLVPRGHMLVTPVRTPLGS